MKKIIYKTNMKTNEEIASWMVKQFEKIDFDADRKVIYDFVENTYPEFWKEFTKEVESGKVLFAKLLLESGKFKPSNELI